MECPGPLGARATAQQRDIATTRCPWHCIALPMRRCREHGRTPGQGIRGKRRGRPPRGSPYPALMAVVISMAVVTLAFTVMTLRFIR